MNTNRRVFPKLYGNEKLKKTLYDHITSRKMSHAYILEGTDGSGRMTASLSFAAALSCERKNDVGYPLPCGECASCRKIFGNISPDLKIIDTGDKKTIGVDSVREINRNISVTPNDGDYCVYVIKDAQLMTVQAQNSLLKSLEEPPPFVIFFLLCDDCRSLLETIRSRSPVFRTERLSAERMRSFILSTAEGEKLQKKDPQKVEEIIMLSGSSPGKALELLSTSKESTKKSRNMRGSAESLVSALISRRSVDITDAVRSVPRGRDNCTELLTLCRNALCDILTVKSGADADMVFYTDAEVPRGISGNVSYARLDFLFSRIGELISELSQNANEDLVTSVLSVL